MLSQLLPICRVELRPATLGHQRTYMPLIVKTWHRIVRLRCKVCARDPACSERLEYRKASAVQQAVNERGDKHSLAGVRKPGNTKPNRRIEQMAAELDRCSSGEPTCSMSSSRTQVPG